jgi:menaquinone-9 beta-reductase
MFDLIVGGAGPAGASAAITAAQAGASVLLLERGRFPRNKVCGEFIPGESLELLNSLLHPSGAALVVEAQRIPQTRLFSRKVILTSPVNPPAASIARLDLDVTLWESAGNNGVEAHDRTTVQAIEGEGPFTVRTSEGSFEARCVINASGRWSNLTVGTKFSGNLKHKYLGLKAHFSEEDSCPSVDLYFFDGGYCGVQPVALHAERNRRDRINVCALVRADIASSLRDVFEQNPSLRERSRNWQPLTGPVCTSPLIFRRPRPTDGNLIFAGDAAGFVDPFTGNGISLALRSGRLAAHSLAPFLRGETSLKAAAQSYGEAYERRLVPFFRTASKVRHLFFLMPEVARTALLYGVKHSTVLTQYIVQHSITQKHDRRIPVPPISS